jgi:regulator of sigma E protease
MTILVFIIVLAALVFVHELGHFLAAKLSGIRVDEFGLGFPPKLWGIRKGETTYSINAIPFGGYVKIFGENPDYESMEGPDKDRSFYNKPKSIQAIVLAAGVIFNVIFAWLLLSLGFMVGMSVPLDYVGHSGTVQNAKLTITSVQLHSPAEEVGLKPGDRLIQFKSGADVLNVPTTENIALFNAAHANKPITITFDRAQEVKTVTVTPKKGIVTDPDTGVVEDRAAIGITTDNLGILKLPFLSAFWEGAKLTYFLVKITIVTLAQFIYQALTGAAHFAEVSGPVGIAGMVGDATRLGIAYLLSFTALISINLAVMNLIPFPALDGGRLLFTLIEKIKGSAINPRVANLINSIGFALLIMLMLVVTYNDVIKLIK